MLVYTTRRHKDKYAANMITDTFTIHSHPYFALIDVGSTHSYITSMVSSNLGIFFEDTSFKIFLISPLG